MSEEEGEPTEGYEEQSGQANGGPCQLCDVPSTCLRRRVNQLRAMRNSQGRQVVDHASFVTFRVHV